MPKQDVVSFALEDMPEGGGLLGAEGPELIRITNPRYEDGFEYPEPEKGWKDGDPGPQVVFRIDAERLDPDTQEAIDDETWDQVWSCGKNVVPDRDGEHLIKDGDRGLGRNTNFGVLILSAGQKAGMDVAEFQETGASYMDGFLVMVERLGDLPTKRPREVLQIVEIIEGADGGKKRGGKKTTSRSSSRSSSSRKKTTSRRKPKDEPEEFDATESASTVLQAVLGEHDGELPKARIVPLTRKFLRDNEDDYEVEAEHVKDIIKVLMNSATLKKLDGVSVEGGTVSAD